jgi:branched-subunit amino acid transport protein
MFEINNKSISQTVILDIILIGGFQTMQSAVLTAGVTAGVMAYVTAGVMASVMAGVTAGLTADVTAGVTSSDNETCDWY